MKKNAFILIRNQRGDALVIAMIMAVACTLTGLALLQYASQMEENSRRPRVKALMAATEAKVRELLLSPNSYAGCASQGDRSACDFAPNIFDTVRRPVSGAACEQGSGASYCGIRVSSSVFTRKTTDGVPAKAVVTIQYTGRELSLAELKVEMDIPTDVTQSTGLYVCPTTEPKFLGFRPDGGIHCQALPVPAPAGSFVRDINLDDLSMTTQALDDVFDCNASPYSDQMIGTVRWGSGGTSFVATCRDRAEPFTEFGFTPGSLSYDRNNDL